MVSEIIPRTEIYLTLNYVSGHFTKFSADLIMIFFLHRLIRIIKNRNYPLLYLRQWCFESLCFFSREHVKLELFVSDIGIHR